MRVGRSKHCCNDVHRLLWAVGEARRLRQREGVAARTSKDLQVDGTGGGSDAGSGRVGASVAGRSEFFTEWQPAA